MATEVTHRVKEGSATIALHEYGDYGTVTIALGRARYVTASAAGAGIHVGVHLADDAALELLAALTAFYATRDEHDEPAEVRP